MLWRWDKRIVDQASDVPSIIFFMISCKILCKNPFNWAKWFDKYPVFGNSFLWYRSFRAYKPRFEFAVQRLLWFVYSESYVMLSVIVYVYWTGFRRVKLRALREVWPDRWWYYRDIYVRQLPFIWPCRLETVTSFLIKGCGSTWNFSALNVPRNSKRHFGLDFTRNEEKWDPLSFLCYCYLLDKWEIVFNTMISK